MKRITLGVILSATLLSLIAVPSLAQSPRVQEAREKSTQIKEEKKAEREARVASRSALKKEKLEATKLQVCERKQENIKRRATNIASRAERQFQTFTSIEERVSNYYTEKGLVVDNYDELKNLIIEKKAVVEVAIEATKESADNFDCKGDDPKGQLTNFKEDYKDVIAALKEYRTSIKNLIVAVRTADSEKEASDSAETN